MNSRTALVALILTAVVAGCGGSSSSDEDQIKATTSDFVSAVKKKDWAGACDQLSKAAQDELMKQGAALKAKDCADTLTKAANLGGDDAFKGLATDVTNIKVNGNKATAKNGKDDANFVKEGGEWKIDIGP
jgi:hypothetical protein